MRRLRQPEREGLPRAFQEEEAGIPLPAALAVGAPLREVALMGRLYILQDLVASKRLGKPIWFRQMTGIGPETTKHLKLAHIFRSREEAAASPAMWFLLTFFKIVPAPKRLADWHRGHERRMR